MRIPINRPWSQLLALTLLAWTGALPAAQAQAEPVPSWQPTKAAEFVVPGGAGAALDLAARKLTDLLARENHTSPFVVSNKPGAHSIQALETVYRQAGDAHTLITLSSGYVTSQAQNALPEHLQTLTPLATLFREFVAVVVREDSPIQDVNGLVAALKQDPGALSIGIANTLGNHIHLGAAQPLKQAGVDIAHLRVVPYKSSAESMSALVGGHLDVVAATTPNLLPYLQSGRVRVIAIGAEQRLQGDFAQAPTWKEQGIDYVNQAYQGVMTVPDATPAQVAYWIDALEKATQTPDWQAFVTLNQWEPYFLGPDETRRAIAQQTRQTHELLAELGLIPDAAPRHVAQAAAR
ncbi:tripartite tricarboxylate transporter substrate binding protein [Verticiella sediminum]|uniref:Tripartite tricarboxylate transporter substrate binding protein n=1 Tax=Verticiella sediminum TaxID=1247510 RepID=A0A556A848_9BURK|nr:tripartite tricarboxylate transporter substrate binding protein [Verticiella sediminum]TSH89043.1 tripartite tricarboxylate transporter substrate binding protein [Verticiella sediminum]